jgi:hypothetical protein
MKIITAIRASWYLIANGAREGAGWRIEILLLANRRVNGGQKEQVNL